MREELLGYLLSALDPHEMRLIDQRLREDPQLREELAEVERTLRAVDASMADNALADIPADLVSRTMSFIAQADTGDWEGGGKKACAEDSQRFPVAMRPESDFRPKRERAWADVLVSGLAAATLLAITFPTIQQFRAETRKNSCQNNLRQLGIALSQFVFSRGDSQLPGVAEAGAESFAGMYAIRLADIELLNDREWLHCPSRDTSTLEMEPMPPPPSRQTSHLLVGGQGGGATGQGGNPILPSRSRIETSNLGPATLRPGNLGSGNREFENRGAELLASGAAPRGGQSRLSTHPELIRSEHLRAAVAVSDYSLLRWIQRHAGGHFAYLLGVVDDSTYKAPRYEGRSAFAVLGDAPIAGHQGTEAVDVTKLRYSHGEGANLLFEDGSVRHVLPAQMAELSDHPYINHRGAIEAGMNIDDAVLAPSWVGPFPRKRQR